MLRKIWGYLTLSVVILLLLRSCWLDRFNTIQPPSIAVENPAVALNLTKQIDSIGTKKLFLLLSSKEMGDISGKVELRKEGILIHPGVNTPTYVSFHLSKHYQKLILRPYIAPLPVEAKNLKEAGTAKVEFFGDGKSLGKIDVNRDTNTTKTLDLGDVETLNVIVGNQDGKAWFDWFMLGVVSE